MKSILALMILISTSSLATAASPKLEKLYQSRDKLQTKLYYVKVAIERLEEIAARKTISELEAEADTAIGRADKIKTE